METTWLTDEFELIILVAKFNRNSVCGKILVAFKIWQKLRGKIPGRKILHIGMGMLNSSNVQNHNQNAQRRIMRKSAFLSPARMWTSVKPPKSWQKFALLHILRNHSYAKEILPQLSQCGCGLPHYSSKFAFYISGF